MELTRMQVAILEWILAIACIVLIAAIPILLIRALVHISRREFANPNDKLVWVIISIFVPLVGPLLYLRNGKSQP
ncbi:MAG: PLDc N-terminal domain-containing protein [Bacteroidota bacterium]